MRAATDRPNVVLINCDDLGYGDLGCYGSTTHRTPALDKLASQGARLTDFYMASPVCSPSRGGMMTGCYPPRIGFGRFEGHGVLFPGQGVGLNPSEITMASLLKDQGYATCHIGKWHCGDQKEFLPTRHGFDHYYGIPYSNDMGIQKSWPKQWNFKRNYPPLPLMNDEDVMQAQPDQANLIERYTEAGVRFMRENIDQPFFLYLAHMQVHLPLYAPARFVRESKNGRYGACVEAVDWSTAVLMHELKQLGLEENTIVIFTSDNGGRALEGGSNAPLHGMKGETWEGGIRVPCLIRWKGQVKAGVELKDMVSSMDFLPTLVNWAGSQAPTDRIIDGLNVGDYLLGKEDASPRDTFFYYFLNRLEAVRHGKWKLFAAAGLTEDHQPGGELYDLEADIGEKINVAADHPDIVTKLSAMLQQCRVDIGDELTETTGKNTRSIGQVDNPKPLTTHDADYPYIVAEYDLPERG